MRTKITIVSAALLLTVGLTGCSKKDKGTAIGAGIGAASGYAISGGNAGGAVVGGVAGGVLGRVIADDR